MTSTVLFIFISTQIHINFSKSLNKKTKKKLVLSTHIEVIRLWVINHLNEIDYIRMFHHFHNENLEKEK